MIKMSKTDNNYICNICNYVSSNKHHYNKHLATLKHTNKSVCSSLAINGNGLSIIIPLVSKRW